MARVDFLPALADGVSQAHDLRLKMLMALLIRRHVPDHAAKIATVAIHHRLVAGLWREKPSRQPGENTDRQDAVFARGLVIRCHA